MRAAIEHQEAGRALGGAAVDVNFVVGSLSPALEGLSGVCIHALNMHIFPGLACGSRESSTAIQGQR